MSCSNAINTSLGGTRSGWSKIGGGLGQRYLFGHDTSEALSGQRLSLEFDAAPHVP